MPGSPTGRTISTRALAARSAIASCGLAAGRPDDNPARNIPAGFNRHTAGIAARGIAASVAIAARASTASAAMGRNRGIPARTAKAANVRTTSTACSIPGSPTGPALSARAGAATSAMASRGLATGRPEENPARNILASFNRHAAGVAARRITASATIATLPGTATSAIGRNRGTPAGAAIGRTAITACNITDSTARGTISARAIAATSAMASRGLTAGRPDDNPARNVPAGFNRHTAGVAARRIAASAAIAARASTARTAIN